MNALQECCWVMSDGRKGFRAYKAIMFKFSLRFEYCTSSPSSTCYFSQSVVIKSMERNVANVYEARQRILGIDEEIPVVTGLTFPLQVCAKIRDGSGYLNYGYLEGDVQITGYPDGIYSIR